MFIMRLCLLDRVFDVYHASLFVRVFDVYHASLFVG